MIADKTGAQRPFRRGTGQHIATNGAQQRQNLGNFKAICFFFLFGLALTHNQMDTICVNAFSTIGMATKMTGVNAENDHAPTRNQRTHSSSCHGNCVHQRVGMRAGPLFKQRLPVDQDQRVQCEPDSNLQTRNIHIAIKTKRSLHKRTIAPRESL